MMRTKFDCFGLKMGQQRASRRHAGLSKPAWAWEFLRRNEDYRRDYWNAVSYLPNVEDLPSGSRLIIGERRYKAARKWGLLFFADPRKDAGRADVFWRPSLFPGTIPVSLRDRERELERDRYRKRALSDTVILSRLGCRRVLFESINQSRHVVLNARRVWLQLYCDSAHPVDDEAIIDFRFEGATHANRRMKHLRQLFELHRSMGRKMADIGYIRNANTFREAVIALDIRAMGGSYQDIAKALYGKRTVVESDWNNGCSRLKQKARRALERGRNYRNGKYLELLS